MRPAKIIAGSWEWARTDEARDAGWPILIELSFDELCLVGDDAAASLTWARALAHDAW